MAKRPKVRMSLEEILQSISVTLFPAEMGAARVHVCSRDVDGDTPLHVMAMRGDRYACQALVDAGADVDAVGDMGQTPLHIAITYDHIEIIDLLLRAGARTDIVSEFGETPLQKASNKGGEIARLVNKPRQAF